MAEVAVSILHHGSLFKTLPLPWPGPWPLPGPSGLFPGPSGLPLGQCPGQGLSQGEGPSALSSFRGRRAGVGRVSEIFEGQINLKITKIPLQALHAPKNNNKMICFRAVSTMLFSCLDENLNFGALWLQLSSIVCFFWPSISGFRGHSL